jgi:hypothetical protein
VTEWIKIGSAIVRLDDLVAVCYSDISRPTVEAVSSGGCLYTAVDDEAVAVWSYFSVLDVLAEPEPLHRRAKLVN